MKKRTSIFYDLFGASNLVLGVALAVVSALAVHQYGRSKRLEGILDAIEDDIRSIEGDDDDDPEMDDEEMEAYLDNVRTRFEVITICRGRSRGCNNGSSSRDCPYCLVFNDDDPRSSAEIVQDFRRMN